VTKTLNNSAETIIGTPNYHFFSAGIPASISVISDKQT
jgi:hypothetical protein